MHVAVAPHLHEAFARAQRQLARAVGALRQQANGQLQVHRLSVDVPDVDPLRWLIPQAHPMRMYWSGRDDARELAAVGAAHVLHDDAQHAVADVLAQRHPSTDPNVRYFGGLRFDPTRTPGSTWTRFGAYGFILPRIELVRADEGTQLACNIVWPQDADRLDEVAEHIRALAPATTAAAASLPYPVARRDAPDREGWAHNVDSALRLFAHTALDKVVLARKVALRFDEPLDAALLLLRLRDSTPNCFHFYFQPSPGHAFLGATPERLYARDGRTLQSEAVAGTRPRGHTLQADTRLGNELLGNDKEQREHAFVREHLANRLAPLTDALDVDPEAQLMKLAKKQHLLSRVRATLRPAATDAALIRTLHPTPAVGGAPTDIALRVIRDMEPFDRGWYTGPIGWIGNDAAEFAVAIRCGLVHDDGMALYSGAGIVAGSDPEAEWEEIEHKLSDFVNVLTNG